MNIPLTKGQVAIVDAEDFEGLNQYHWYARWDHCTKSYYAMRNTRFDGRRMSMSMHRQLLSLLPGDRRKGDHVNHDTLDNRRQNLRIATHAENARNARTRIGGSGFKGVSLLRRTNKWSARIRVDKKSRFLGYFNCPKEAHAAYALAAQELHGEFACTGGYHAHSV